MALIEFLFILALPLALVAAGLAGLFGLGALFDALENPGDLRGRIEGVFRRPPKPPKIAGRGHYYRPYWSAP